MISLVSLGEENKLQFINWDAKVHDSINQETKWNIHIISDLLPPNVLLDIKSIPIPSNPLKIEFYGVFLGRFTFKSTTWAMRKPLVHPRNKILSWIWNLSLMSKINFFLWLVLREALPTCECLIARRLEIRNKCVCVIRTMKILTIFLRIALSLKQFEIV